MESLPELVLDKIINYLPLETLIKFKEPGIQAVSERFVNSSQRCLNQREKLTVGSEQEPEEWDYFKLNSFEIINLMPNLKEVTIHLPNLFIKHGLLKHVLKSCSQLEVLHLVIRKEDDLMFLRQENVLLKLKKLTCSVVNFDALTLVMDSSPYLKSLHVSVSKFSHLMGSKGSLSECMRGLKHGLINFKFSGNVSKIEEVFISPAMETLQNIELEELDPKSKILSVTELRPCPKLISLKTSIDLDQNIINYLTKFNVQMFKK